MESAAVPTPRASREPVRAAKALLEAAAERNARMIVGAAKGALNGLLRGTAAHELLNRSGRPVLVVLADG